MADPRVKKDRKPITFRLDIPQRQQLVELAQRYGKPQNTVVNELIKDAHKRLISTN